MAISTTVKSRTSAIPPQAVPAVDPKTGAINKTWWLALQAQNAIVNSLAAAVPATPAAVTIQNVALVHATTTGIVPSVPPTLGALLLVILTQDSSGQGQITWTPGSGNFIAAYLTVNIGILPNAQSVFLFCGVVDGGLPFWLAIAQPLLGQI